ncbi:hypothetical protein V1520DRAFT_174405 [Lipomyces starkeyi]
MGYCHAGASGARIQNSLEGGVHQNSIAKFSHFNASTGLSYNLLHGYVHIHNTTVGHQSHWYSHKAQSEFFDMPQDFKGYLNTSFYKITGEQFLISPIPHNSRVAIHSTHLFKWMEWREMDVCSADANCK